MTGSGKSHSMIGYNNEKGLFHLAVEDLLNTINQSNQQTGKNQKYLELSFAEI